MIRKVVRKLRSFGAPAAPAAAPADNDVFSGYYPEDKDKVAALMASGLSADPRAYVDVFGVKVDPSYCPWVKAGQIEAGLPFPSGYLGDGIEFVATALALEAAAGQKSFTAVELGAGWGPWTALAAVCAQRAGFKDIYLAAFEADRTRFEIMQKHLALNGITKERFHLKLFCAAAWWRDETLYWPVEQSGFDAGLAAVSGERPAQDYRGKELAYEEIPGLSLATALKDFPPIDFLHIDIQGGEWDLIANAVDDLSSRVRTMYVGTHSRKIEGDLIDLLRTRGWTLLRERPCRFYSMADAPTLTGLTYHDGGQFWRNDRAPAR